MNRVDFRPTNANHSKKCKYMAKQAYRIGKKENI